MKIVTAKQIREIDRLSSEQFGIPSILLMENAAPTLLPPDGQDWTLTMLNKRRFFPPKLTWPALDVSTEKGTRVHSGALGELSP